MLIESDNRLDAFVEVVEAVVLVGRVDGVFAEAEVHQDGLDTHTFSKVINQSPNLTCQ